MPDKLPEWHYIIRGDKRLGPFTIDEMAEGVERGEFSLDDQVQREDGEKVVSLRRALLYRRSLPVAPRRNPLKHAPGEHLEPKPVKFKVPPFAPDAEIKFDSLWIGHMACRILAAVLLGLGLVQWLFALKIAGLLSIPAFVNVWLVPVLLWILSHVLLVLRALERNTRRTAAATEWLALREWTEIANERREAKATDLEPAGSPAESFAPPESDRQPPREHHGDSTAPGGDPLPAM